MELIPVTDLKQWAYCRRIVFYHRVMAGAGQPTYKMAEGQRAQELIETLEMRRGLQEYGLLEAERRFGLWLSNDAAGLSGKLDLLLLAPERAAVVEFKLTSGEVGDNHRLQLAGYALLAETAFDRRVDLGFVYRIPDNRIFPVPITGDLRARVAEAVQGMRRVAELQELPDPTPVRGRCLECEYANYCGDIW